MGLLEKAGNIQTNEKEPVKETKSVAEEVAAYDATVAKAVKAPKAVKKGKRVKKAKSAKAPKVRNNALRKSFPKVLKK